MRLSDFDELPEFRRFRRDLAIKVCEQARCAFARRHGYHFAASLAEPEPARCPGRQMHQPAQLSDRFGCVDAER
jgi:hypothetical protein